MKFCGRFIVFLSVLFVLPAFSEGNFFEFVLTNNKEIENQMLFLDKLETCTPHLYHAEPAGIYQIIDKVNNTCYFKWTMAECYFPPAVSKEFARVQRHRIIERAERLDAGYREELKDRNYRYLLYTGNKYCKIRY